jgi:hypothetical protein
MVRTWFVTHKVKEPSLPSSILFYNKIQKATMPFFLKEVKGRERDISWNSEIVKGKEKDISWSMIL